MPERRKSSRAAQFRIGDKVRVRHGVTDNDYPDMPIGGWAGTISETHDGDTHVVRWSEETLASIHPVFKNRCENDGLDYEQYSIGADDLELDMGGPLDIEQPQQMVKDHVVPKPKRKLTAAEKRARRERKENYMTIFIGGKQKRVRRPPQIDGMDVDEFIRRNGDPIGLHQNEMWEYMTLDGEDNGS